jgi:hypothetical protein
MCNDLVRTSACKMNSDMNTDLTVDHIRDLYIWAMGSTERPGRQEPSIFLWADKHWLSSLA